MGAFLRDNKTVGEIVVYGGGAILLQFHWRLSTQDVDAMVVSDGDHGLVRRAADQAAAELGLERSWLSEAVARYTSPEGDKIDPAPAPLGDAERDAWIGAIGEHLAQRWGLKIPAWTQRPGHFALKTPVFMPPSKALQTLLICESPAAFRSRLIFTFAEPLERARFPKGVARVRMPWDDRASREPAG